MASAKLVEIRKKSSEEKDTKACKDYELRVFVNVVTRLDDLLNLSGVGNVDTGLDNLLDFSFVGNVKSGVNNLRNLADSVFNLVSLSPFINLVRLYKFVQVLTSLLLSLLYLFFNIVVL